MPFIDVKITKKLDGAMMDELKTGLGAAMAVIGKPESYTMIGIQDGYTLYFGGRRLGDGAFIAVDVLAERNPSNSAAFTEEVCRLLEQKLDIPPANVYVEYRHTKDWGWNGANF